jgi:Gpi18-like mannosyltransferase
VLLFCFFPGSVVFSMVYPEGLLLALTAGSMLALSHKRWLLAGLLAGLATAIGPDALVVVPMCLTASVVELKRQGWTSRTALRSLVAPVLAPVGAVAFALFLWAWTGSPLANYTAQKYGWNEKTTPFAIPTQVLDLMHEMDLNFHWFFLRFYSSGRAGYDPNRVVAIIGTVFLIAALVWLWRERKTVPLEILVYSGLMAVVMVTSEHVPPNPRLLITAFPLVMVLAKRLHGQAWKWALALSVLTFVLLSGLTFVGNTLRP